MASSALLDKNAYLSIYITHDTITANLAYSHYAIGRHYLLNDTTFFYPENDQIERQAFWDEYFDVLEKKFSWKLLDNRISDISMAQIHPFLDEGDGVAGITFNFQGNLENRVKLQSVLHSYVPTASIKVIDQNWLESSMPGISSKTEYNDILFLNAELQYFDLYRFRNPLSKDNQKSKGKEKYRKEYSKIHWDNKTALINSIKDKKFSAFSSIDTTTNTPVNLWANFVYRPVDSSGNRDLHDILRSFLTVQLTSMNYNSPQVSKNFGEQFEGSLIIICGRLAKFLNSKEIIIGLLDGLEIFGNFDLYIDKEERFTTYGEMYSKGINSNDFIVPVFTLFERMEKVFSVDVDGKRDKRHAVFSGELIQGGETEQIYSVSPSVDMFELKYPEDRPSVMTGRMQKKAFIIGNEKELTVTSSHDTSIVGSVTFDSRPRPVVYGPDPASNRAKVNSWLGE